MLDPQGLTGDIIQEAIHIHRAIGPGLREHVYTHALVHRLRKRGLFVETELVLAYQFEDLVVPDAYRVDIVVENRVPIEAKAQWQLHRRHASQLRTYLLAGNWEVGLLMNFWAERLVDDLRRVSNDRYVPPDRIKPPVGNGATIRLCSDPRQR